MAGWPGKTSFGDKKFGSRPKDFPLTEGFIHVHGWGAFTKHFSA